MRLRDHYDWVVLGDHPAALLSAALVSRLGLSVLILPLCPGMKAHLSPSGQLLDPEPNFLLGFGDGEKAGLWWEALKAAGIAPAEAEALLRNRPSEGNTLLQVVTPRSRLEVSSDHQALTVAIEREFGDLVRRTALLDATARAEGELLKLWGGYPERFVSDPRKKRKPAAPGHASQWLGELQTRLARGQRGGRGGERTWLAPAHKLSSLERDEEARRGGFYETCLGLWQGAFGRMGWDEGSEPALADVTHALALVRSAGACAGGQTAFREVLAKIARRAGAHLPADSECRRIFVSNGKFIGVQLSNHGNMIGATGGALGCSAAQAEEITATSGRNLLRRMRPAPVARGWRFTVAVTVHAEAIPQGMAISRRLIWQEAGAPLLEIEVAQPSEYGLTSAAGQYRLLFLRSTLPFDEESLKPANRKIMAARMLRRAAELLPFLEYHIVRIYPDFRRDESEGATEVEQAYPFSNLQMIPENLRVFAGKGAGAESGIEGLFLASGEAYPELGSLGPLLGAIEGMSWLAHKAGLPGPWPGSGTSAPGDAPQAGAERHPRK